jgi:hypothetical protein
VIVIVLVVVAVVGGAVYILLNQGGGKSLGTGATPGANTPPFQFHVKNSKPISTAASGKTNQGAVSTAAKDIGTTLTHMYALAFLDPDHWKKSDYDVVFGFFSPGKAAASAKRDVATLTLGPGAGDKFSDVQPGPGSIAIRILTGRDGKPVESAANADFTARATDKDGSTTTVMSHATYYLHPTSDGWVIVGYRVVRKDRGGGTPSTGASS